MLLLVEELVLSSRLLWGMPLALRADAGSNEVASLEEELGGAVRVETIEWFPRNFGHNARISLTSSFNSLRGLDHHSLRRKKALALVTIRFDQIEV